MSQESDSVSDCITVLVIAGVVVPLIQLTIAVTLAMVIWYTSL